MPDTPARQKSKPQPLLPRDGSRDGAKDNMDGFITSMIHRQRKLLYCLLPQQVRAVRQTVGGTQRAFAARFGLSRYTLAQWENGRRAPDRAASALLKVIAFAPDVVEAALYAQPSMMEALRQTGGTDTSTDPPEQKQQRVRLGFGGFPDKSFGRRID